MMHTAFHSPTLPLCLSRIQIFVTPDTADEPLTTEDIARNFPTLKMQGMERMTVDTSTPAIAFESEAPDLGPDKELWFSHNGFSL